MLSISCGDDRAWRSKQSGMAVTAAVWGEPVGLRVNQAGSSPVAMPRRAYCSLTRFKGGLRRFLRNDLAVVRELADERIDLRNVSGAGAWCSR